MAARNGKKAARGNVTMRARRGDVDLRDLVSGRYNWSPEVAQAGSLRVGHAGPSDARTATEALPAGLISKLADTPANLMLLESRLGDLSALVSDLRQRLASVLAPPTPVAQGNTGSGGPPSASQLAETIRDRIRNCDALGDELRDILARLDL